MSITRRELLRRASLFGAASIIPNFTACVIITDGGGEGETGETGSDDLPEYVWEDEPGPDSLFSHSVASGDPLADSVILWTRVTPDDPDAELFFEVALDPAFETRIAADSLGRPDETRDYTFKLDLDGLEPATTYYFRFWIQGVSSPIGRTRTAPAGASEHLRFGVCSCSSLAHGYFHNYRHLAARADLDAVFHLGDYIYEYGTGYYGEVREYEPPTEIITLDDYRTRYAQYRRDPDLQEVHRQHPFIVTWDDHELTNNTWSGGAQNHQPDEEGDFGERIAAATQAYFEWMPLREGPAGGVYRELAYGELVDFIVLDTRYVGRDEQVPLTDADALERIHAPERQLLGAEQEAWLLERLSSSASTWKLVAQQVMMGQLILAPGQDGGPNRPLATDLWDGYEYARRRVLEHIGDNAIDNVVVLTGDIHSSWAHELTTDPLDPTRYDPATGEGSVAVEFVVPGITSPGISIDEATINVLLPNNPHIRYVETQMRGYGVVDVRPDRVQCDWWHIGTAGIESVEPVDPNYAASRSVSSGLAVLTEPAGPADEKTDPPVLAP